MVNYKKWLKHPKAMWIVWPLWIATCFLVASFGFGFIVVSLSRVFGAEELLYSTSGSLIFQTAIFLVMLLLIFGPRQVRKTTNKKTLGINRAMTFGDIGLGIAGYIVYFIILVAVTMIITHLIPAYAADQKQDLGFTMLFGAERMIGFFLFVVVAPIVEEVIMRGFLYGKLRQARMPMWPAALVVSVIFGCLHGQWNVGVDTFILSMVACYLREITGTIWPGVVIHMTKNAVAYVLLFVVMLPG